MLAEFEGSRAVETIKLPLRKADNLIAEILKLRGFIEAGYPLLEEDNLRELGSQFFDLIIRNRVKRLFDTATGRREEGLLPFEIFLEDYNIAGWPWEYLYDTANNMFICQEFHPISRGVFTLIPTESLPPLRGKVQILLIIAVPPDEPGTTPQEEIKWIREVFTRFLGGSKVELKIVEMVAPSQLQMELHLQHFDIVHFYGHGGFDPARKEGYLKFERPDTSPTYVHASTFGQLLAGQNIHLVFLNGCETAKIDQKEDPTKSSMAGALLGRGIPAVIANQFSMIDVSSHYLSSIIYSALASGKSLVEAMRDGRRAMQFADDYRFFDWGIPVLYSSEPNLTFFPHPHSNQMTLGTSAEEPSSDAPKVIPPVEGVLSSAASSEQQRARSQHKDRARRRVALVDINSKAGFLPDLVNTANQAQNYYHFQMDYLPIPAGAVRHAIGEEKEYPHLFLPALEEYLKHATHRLGVDIVCCLTRYLIAEEDADQLYLNGFAGQIRTNRYVYMFSSFGLRAYANQHRISFAKVLLSLCVVGMAAAESRPQWAISDIVSELRQQQFAVLLHKEQFEDQDQWRAIETLLALEDNISMIPDESSSTGAIYYSTTEDPLGEVRLLEYDVSEYDMGVPWVDTEESIPSATEEEVTDSPRVWDDRGWSNNKG
jgi:hypothetical protein